MLPSASTATDHGSVRASSPVGWRVAKQLPILAEDLNTVVQAVGDLDVAGGIDADIGWLVQVALTEDGCRYGLAPVGTVRSASSTACPALPASGGELLGM